MKQVRLLGKDFDQRFFRYQEDFYHEEALIHGYALIVTANEKTICSKAQNNVTLQKELK